MPEGRQQRRNSSEEKEEKESEGMNKGEKRIQNKRSRKSKKQT